MGCLYSTAGNGKEITGWEVRGLLWVEYGRLSTRMCFIYAGGWRLRMMLRLELEGAG
jgi:hypothetical protein